MLPLFGYELFSRGAFGAVQTASVPAGYVLGPGDEVVLQVYGAIDISQSFTIDRDGRILLPKAGPLVLAGVPLADAERVITSHLGRIYRNFSLGITMGRLKGIEIYIVGQARRPGKQIVSSLSSFINALFETQGPNSNGSMRDIQLRRAGKTVAHVDLYKFLAEGDNSADAKLLNGDIIYVPPVGPRVAALGMVNAPAIYELKSGEAIQDVLKLSGGLPVLAAPQKALLERLNPKNMLARSVLEVALDKQGLGTLLESGDVLTVFQISPQFTETIALEGNVASPMRYSFKAGMKISDILSDRRYLIPSSYWTRLNSGASTEDNYSRPEVNLDYAIIQRLDVKKLRTVLIPFNLAKAVARDPVEDLPLQSGDIISVYKPDDAGPVTELSVVMSGQPVGGLRRFAWRSGMTLVDLIPSTQWLIDYYNYWQRLGGNNLKNDINWGYAQIIRREDASLESRSIAFNLGDAIKGANPLSMVKLEPGDQIRLFTTRDLEVPIAKSTRMVLVSGEVSAPGIYQALPGETMGQLLRRIGGLTSQAYVYGTEFSRESIRKRQQDNLDVLVRRLEAQAQSNAQNVTANAATKADSAAQSQALLAQQQAQLNSQIQRLRSLKSTGRMSLELDTRSQALADLPDLPLEDGDHINVPSVPSYVAAFGAVNNENVFLYKPGKTVADVAKSAGLTEEADADQQFLVRADGSVLSRADHSSLFGRAFSSIAVMPGDTLVVPAKWDRETGYNATVRGLKDWTQILANLGLGLAAIKTINN